MGLFDFFKKRPAEPSIDLSDYKFISDDHHRFENGVKSLANNKGAWRGVRIQAKGNDTFLVTMYNLSGTHPVWGDNIQMAPKPMKIIKQDQEKIALRGFGKDQMGGAFSDYGITLYTQGSTVEKVTLHMFDRNIDITYLKGNAIDMNPPKQTEEVQRFKVAEPKVSEPEKESNKVDNEIIALLSFKQKWNTQVSMEQKMSIAMQSDLYNNQGCDSYNNGNVNQAITYFEQALEILPINDDALINIIRGYNKAGNYLKALDYLKRLFYIEPSTLNKQKVIVYSLLIHLMKDFDSDGAVVSSSTLEDFISSKVGFTITVNDVKLVIQRLNEPYNRDIIDYRSSPIMGISDTMYVTTNGTTLSLIKDECRDVLNWN
ncbi:tetratricopeptide repeat protein [Myroides odoratimimus]|uniref:tetratricopeptide repeat protein n=1 Tax=Myroides odoratimimus TaxID=76832 RepID=UPI003101657C